MVGELHSCADLSSPGSGSWKFSGTARSASRPNWRGRGGSAVKHCTGPAFPDLPSVIHRLTDPGSRERANMATAVLQRNWAAVVISELATPGGSPNPTVWPTALNSTLGPLPRRWADERGIPDRRQPHPIPATGCTSRPSVPALAASPVFRRTRTAALDARRGHHGRRLLIG